MNRHILIGRVNHLEKMGLAQPTDKGRWQLDKDAFKTLGQIEHREQLNKEIHAAMERANIKRSVRLNDGRKDYDAGLLSTGLTAMSARSRRAWTRERAKRPRLAQS